MAIADFCTWKRTGCRRWPCTGSTVSTMLCRGTTTSTECRCRTSRPMCAAPPIAQTWKSRDESEDPAVPHGAFGHRCDHEHLHSPRIGRCQGRDDSHGGIERCESRTEQDHRRKTCHSEDVPGNMIMIGS